MRLLVTADLHYDSRRSRPSAEEIARRICRTGGDAVVLVGDSAGADHEPLRQCLRLFADFAGRKFLVPGNHCMWCLPGGPDSIRRYEQVIPAVAAEEGFAVLDHDPAVIDGVGLAGSIGWYDYSYRDEGLDIPLEFYRAKVAPGAAERLGEHGHLIDTFHGRLSDWHFDITTRWMDGVHVRMNLSDEEFLEYVTERLTEQLRAFDADEAVGRVVAFVHHLPTRRLVPPDRPPELTFAAAYLGSDRIGQALAECAKVSHVFCGHSHWPGRCRIGHMEVINVGSTYTEKRMEVLEV